MVAGLSVEQAAMVPGKRPGAVRTAQPRALGRGGGCRTGGGKDTTGKSGEDAGESG